MLFRRYEQESYEKESVMMHYPPEMFVYGADTNFFLLETARKRFIEALNTHQNKELQFDFISGEITIPCYGYLATGKPRFVLVSEKFSLEYSFSVENGISTYEICQVLLMQDGVIHMGNEQHIVQIASIDDENDLAVRRLVLSVRNRAYSRPEIWARS